MFRKLSCAAFAALLIVGGCSSDEEVRTTDSPALSAVMDASEFDLSAMEGSIVVLDFWAVW